MLPPPWLFPGQAALVKRQNQSSSALIGLLSFLGASLAPSDWLSLGGQVATSAVATFKAPAKVQSLARQVQKPLREDTVPSKPGARQSHFM